jgi:excisionase family DNA binding protein
MSIPSISPVEFLTPKDLQKRLKIGKQKATDYAKEMEHYRIGRLIRFTEEALQKWLETRKQYPIQ